MQGAGEFPEIGEEDQMQECGYYDVEQVQRLTKLLLATLAAACVEKTIGDLFNQPAAIAGDMLRELIDSMEQQSAGCAASISSSSSSNRSPLKLLHGMLDSFVRSKSNLLGRVSSRILNSDKKEEKIEELVSELDRSGVWMVGKREVFAKQLLRRLDRDMLVQCQTKVASSEDLAEHKSRCILRPTTCGNEGCTDVFSAIRAELHDSKCPAKIVACEQGCGEAVRRGDMDKHCVTVCAMKVVSCPFQNVGCEDKLPQGTVDEHCSSRSCSHLLAVLHSVQKLEIAMASQSKRIARLEKALLQEDGDEQQQQELRRQELKNIMDEASTLNGSIIHR